LGIFSLGILLLRVCSLRDIEGISISEDIRKNNLFKEIIKEVGERYGY
jgi:hypothetical protein